AKLNQVLPETWSHANPIDIIGDADAERYGKALSVIFEEPAADAILVLNCPTAIVSSTDVARRVAETRGTRREPPVLTSWVGGESVREARGILTRSEIPSYDTPSDAARAFMHLVNYRRNQISLMETPPSLPDVFHPDQQRAADAIAHALASERDWLSAAEVGDVLTAYQIPTAGGATAADPAGAAAAADRLGGPVALKIVSPDILHKSDVGGVVLNLEGPAAVEIAAKAMGERITRLRSGARIEGFRVEPMIQMREAHELIVGVADDVLFGPTILFGQGGTAVEVIADKALALPPLNMRLAREMIARTRISRVLEGYRGLPPADLDAIALTLIKISQMVIDLPALVELDINPLLAGPDGVMALDARIKVAADRAPAADRLAIRPYPKELEEKIEIKDGRALLLRPVVPEDEPSLHAGFAKLTPEEIRLRFFMPLKTLSHVVAARFTQIDYDREMALILTDPGVPGKTEIYGVVRIFADPNNEQAEYAIIVRGDLTGQGLGRLLMQRILDHARRRGIKEIFGDVLRDNTAMLHLCRELGFDIAPGEAEPDIVRVSLRL
ncbi:MAG TPA: GNAT family N-acetyltransferase, partial [Kiloniellales bacterium]